MAQTVVATSQTPDSAPRDELVDAFLAHLQAERGASQYTLRNYGHALAEFARWSIAERHSAPDWFKLERDDFRAYLRFLGRNHLSRAATRLRFSALRSLYRFCMRRGMTLTSPLKNILLPKLEKRLPRFLTPQQMVDLLNAPLQELLFIGFCNFAVRRPRKIHAKPR